MIIAISKIEKERLKNRIISLKKEAPIRVVYLQDFINKANKIKAGSIIYLINNDKMLINAFLNSPNLEGCKIINKQYFANSFDKLEVQQILQKNKILTPLIYDFDSISTQFPIMCKSKNHTSFTAPFNSKHDLDAFLSDKCLGDFYFEEYINASDFVEYKLYFVVDEMFFYDDLGCVPQIKGLQQCLAKISAILGLEVFSVDILTNKKRTYIIDINPASGLYKSAKARKKLVEII